MSNILKTYVIMQVLLLSSVVGYAQTYIAGGSIYTTSWNSINNPYIVQGDIEIPANNTLTINAGVVVYFEDGYSLTVTGTLLVDGSSGNEVLLTADDTDVGWKGIDISNNSNNNTFEYCIIEYVLKNPATCTNNFEGCGAVFLYNSDNVSFTHCTFQYNEVCYAGGGVYAVSSDFQLNNSIIDENVAGYYGGGIFCSTSAPNIQYNYITTNTADYGGGIYITDGSEPAIQYNYINNYNTANNNGGGIFCYDSDPMILENYIDYNIASNGGGLYISNSTFDLNNNSSISNNQAGNNGGGLYLDNMTGQIQEPNISYNNAENNGGGIYMESCSLQVYNSEIKYNTADNDGGGIYITDMPAYPYGVISSSLHHNIADNDDDGEGDGGGIFIDGGEPYISNNEIEHNESCNGSGIALTNETETWVYRNTIQNNDAKVNGGGIYCINSTPEISYNGYTGGMIAYNHALNDGGGVYSLNSDPIFTGNHLIGNAADYDEDDDGNGGGLYYEWNTSPSGSLDSIILNEFRTNTAYNGGGVYLKSDPGDMTEVYQFLNNLVVENTVENDGGGMYFYQIWEDNLTPISPQINSNTIAYNTATNGYGGGLASYNNPNPSLFWFNNNLIYYNTPNSGDANLSTYTSTDDYLFFKHCNIKTSNSGVNLSSVNGCFDSIPVFYNQSNGDYHLKWYPTRSPSLDQGDANLKKTSIDLDNNNRVLFYNIDLGCYEHDHTNYLIYFDEELVKQINITENPEEIQETKEFSFTSFPNPIKNHLTILLRLNIDEYVRISVFDLHGRTIWNKEDYFTKGNYEIIWDRDNNAEGLYLLRILCGNNISTTKLIIK